MKPALVAEQVRVAQRRGREVLKGIDLHIMPGRVYALLGANGAGKSTLSAVMAGDTLAMPMLGGQVFLNGQRLSQLKASALARQRAVLTQYPSLNFDLQVRDVLEMGAYPFPELSPVALSAVVQKAVQMASVESLIDRAYQELSGGEKQRVQFARILVQLFAHYERGDAPRYCLLDEPTASLDPKHQQGLLQAVKQLAVDYHIGVLVVLHDVNLAARYADELVLLADGRLIAQGTPEEVLTSEHLHAVYGVHGTTIAHPFVSGKVLVVF